MGTWESQRGWEIARRLVYYLVEDFVPPVWIEGRNVVDFSVGLGDFSAYLAEQGALSVIATAPERDRERPQLLPSTARWLTGVTANRIAQDLPPNSTDLFCARMVFQFPTWEGDRADPDLMLAHIAEVLAPGGRVVLAVHEFFGLGPPGQRHTHEAKHPLDGMRELTGSVNENAHPLARAEAKRLSGLAELVEFLGLPPREGPLGETGFGLKTPMLVESIIKAGLEIEHAEHIEPFTFPYGLLDQIGTDMARIDTIADRVFEVKRRYLSETDLNPYDRPSLIRRLLNEIAEIIDVIPVPIIRIVGRKPRNAQSSSTLTETSLTPTTTPS